MINLQNASRFYKMGDQLIKALNKVDLKINEGDFLAIMGPSGSGKTTFLNLIGGLDTPDSGKILVDEVDLNKLSDRKLSKYRNKKIGFVFQSFNLQPTLNALENVMMPLYFAKIREGKKRKKAKAVLKLVGLENRMKHKPSELSAGQRQRVSIARALVNKPNIILADEPTGNLDSKTGKEIMNFLKALNSDRKVTIVMVTHDEEMARYASRTIKIKDGQIK